MNLSLSQEHLTVCQLAAEAPIPEWAATARSFVSITRTKEELSIVCTEDLPPSAVKQESGWRMFKIEGPLDFGLTGILASVLDPLAKAGVSIFAISTFNTDYVLVKADRVDAAIHALRAAGHAVDGA
ncbi:MAG: ACT domain-containing protein [Verrucomicrobiota bacterium]